jgi:hypothetical protein
LFAIRYTSVPMNGRNRTNSNQTAFLPPPMSWRRKMSATIRKSRKNHAIQRKKTSIDQKTSRNG